MPDSEKESKEIQLVIFQLGREEFAVEVTQVREIIRMQDITKMPNAPPFVEGIINLRGQIIAVIDLAGRMNMERSETDAETRIIVVEVGDIKVGMIVDSVSEVMRISTDDIEPSPALAADVEAVYIKGVVKLENRLLILLDLARVLGTEEVAELSF